MDGLRSSVTAADGIEIGLLTAGAGRPLLLVHGGMGRLESWEPVWAGLTARRQVTAMDRRGRGSSGDGESYDITQEFDDIAIVAAGLAHESGSAIDVFAHSFGATCTLGAAARGAQFRRAVLYEPPGPPTVSEEWVGRVTAMIAAGQPGRAMMSFLTEIIGLTLAQVQELRDASGSGDVLPIVTATMPREAQAIAGVDLVGLARQATCPALLLLGSNSPVWAGTITDTLAKALPVCELGLIPGQGHEAINSAPDLIVEMVLDFLDSTR